MPGASCLWESVPADSPGQAAISPLRPFTWLAKVLSLTPELASLARKISPKTTVISITGFSDHFYYHICKKIYKFEQMMQTCVTFGLTWQWNAVFKKAPWNKRHYSVEPPSGHAWVYRSAQCCWAMKEKLSSACAWRRSVWPLRSKYHAVMGRIGIGAMNSNKTSRGQCLC